jgi:hypothetical protein
MSDTPRTDKSEVCFSSLCNPKDAMWVPSKVSRELERENVNLRDVLRRAQHAHPFASGNPGTRQRYRARLTPSAGSKK